MGAKPDILIIDDDRDMVQSMKVILESRGYSVRSAGNGRDGLLRLEEAVPDLLVLDVMMTTVTEGFDLAYKLKRRPEFAGLPILMITGFTQRMAEAGPEGFQHVLGEEWPVSMLLEKPVDPDELLRHVAALLAQGALP
jgi:CheY-like chemotaxis protein